MLRRIYEVIGRLFVFTEEYGDIKRELHILDNARKNQQEFAKKQVESIISCQKKTENLSEKVIEMQESIRAEINLSAERKARKMRKQV